MRPLAITADDVRAPFWWRSLAMRLVVFAGAASVASMLGLAVAASGGAVTTTDQVRQVMVDLAMIDAELQVFRKVEGRWPASLDELLEGPSPHDPWSRPYALVPAHGASKPDVVSWGADGEPGGSGPDADWRLSDLATSFDGPAPQT